MRMCESNFYLTMREEDIEDCTNKSKENISPEGNNIMHTMHFIDEREVSWCSLCVFYCCYMQLYCELYFLNASFKS